MTPPPLHLGPVALGLGCDRGTPLATLVEAIHRALHQCGLSWAQVARAASITLKADEPALLDLAAQRGWALRFYAPQELAAVDVPHPSEVVRRHTGTPSVSEAAALLVADAPDASALLVDKFKWRGADGRHATVSIALIAPRHD